jgi:hypothetical protein
MARKKNPIVLEKLASQKDSELKDMLAELQDNTATSAVEPARWSMRFAASGKHVCAPAPRIRL